MTLDTLQAACESLGHTLTEDTSMRQFVRFHHTGDPVYGVTTHTHFGLPPDPDLDAVAAWVERLHTEAAEIGG